MLHQIANDVYRMIRERGGLSFQEVADAIGKKWQVPWRWEKKQQENLPKRSYEAILVEQSNLTREAFGEIMCEVLTKFVGRRFTMGPTADYIPAMPLSRAAKLFSLHRDQLDPEVQGIIEETMCQGRSLEAESEQTVRLMAKHVTRLIEEGLHAKGKHLSTDSDG